MELRKQFIKAYQKVYKKGYIAAYNQNSSTWIDLQGVFVTSSGKNEDGL